MVTIEVYMDDGRVFKYDVSDAVKAREHAHRIITKGWRNYEDGKMVYYPVYQVLKVCWEMSDPDTLAKKYEVKTKG